MSTISTFQVGADLDDGYCLGSTFARQYDTLGYLGYGNSNNYNTFYRWSSVTVPQGANIVSAKVQLKAYTSNSNGTVIGRIAFNDVDSADSPTSLADYNGKALTSAYVDWTLGAWTLNTWYDSPDIKDIVQEIVNRGGWSSGGAMMAMIKNIGSNNYRNPSHYYSGEANAAKLVIEYTTSNIKTVNGLAIASVKTYCGLAIASVKSIDGLV